MKAQENQVAIKEVKNGYQLWKLHNFNEDEKNWIAKIVGKDSKYKFKRVFLRIIFVGGYVKLEEGGIYQVQNMTGRKFFKVENGNIYEISEDEVMKELENKPFEIVEKFDEMIKAKEERLFADKWNEKYEHIREYKIEDIQNDIDIEIMKEDNWQNLYDKAYEIGDRVLKKKLRKFKKYKLNSNCKIIRVREDILREYLEKIGLTLSM